MAPWAPGRVSPSMVILEPWTWAVNDRTRARDRAAGNSPGIAQSPLRLLEITCDPCGADLSIRQHPQVGHAPPLGNGIGGVEDGVAVNAVVRVKLIERSGLAEMLDAQ